jgi:hypothetical protein
VESALTQICKAMGVFNSCSQLAELLYLQGLGLAAVKERFGLTMLTCKSFTVVTQSLYRANLEWPNLSRVYSKQSQNKPDTWFACKHLFSQATTIKVRDGKSVFSGNVASSLLPTVRKELKKTQGKIPFVNAATFREAG